MMSNVAKKSIYNPSSCLSSGERGSAESKNFPRVLHLSSFHLRLSVLHNSKDFSYFYSVFLSVSNPKAGSSLCSGSKCLQLHSSTLSDWKSELCKSSKLQTVGVLKYGCADTKLWRLQRETVFHPKPSACMLSEYLNEWLYMSSCYTTQEETGLSALPLSSLCTCYQLLSIFPNRHREPGLPQSSQLVEH